MGRRKASESRAERDSARALRRLPPPERLSGSKNRWQRKMAARAAGVGVVRRRTPVWTRLSTRRHRRRPVEYGQGAAFWQRETAFRNRVRRRVQKKRIGDDTRRRQRQRSRGR